MKLYHKATYKALRRRVRKAGGTSWWRRMEALWKRLTTTKDSRTVGMLFILILLIFKIETSLPLSLFFCSTLTLSYTLLLANRLLVDLNSGPELQTMAYFPISDREFFHYRWNCFKRLWMAPAFGFAVMNCVLAHHFHSNGMGYLTGVMLGIMQGFSLPAMAAMIAAAIPTWHLFTVGSLLAVSIFGLLTITIFQKSALEQHAQYASLFFPTAWVTWGYVAGLLKGNLLGLIAVLPLGALWIGMQMAGRWMRNEYVMPELGRAQTAEGVFTAQLDQMLGPGPGPEVPELEALEHEPERAAARAELRRDYLVLQRERVNTYVTEKHFWNEETWGFCERILIRWFTPRQRTLFEFMFPAVPRITRNFLLGYLSLIILCVLLHFYTFKPWQLPVFWVGILLATILNLGFSLSSRAEALIALGARWTPHYAYFPVSYKDLYGVKFKYLSFRFLLWLPALLIAFTLWNIELPSFISHFQLFGMDGLFCGAQAALTIFVLLRLLISFSLMGNLSQNFTFNLKGLVTAILMLVSIGMAMGIAGLMIGFYADSWPRAWYWLGGCLFLAGLFEWLFRWKYHSSYFDLIGEKVRSEQQDPQKATL